MLRADFEARGLERFDFPTVRKGMAQLGLRDASRPLVSRGSVTETKQEQPPVRVEDALETSHVAKAVGVRENVKQT